MYEFHLDYMRAYFIKELHCNCLEVTCVEKQQTHQANKKLNYLWKSPSNIFSKGDNPKPKGLYIITLSKMTENNEQPLNRVYPKF